MRPLLLLFTLGFFFNPFYSRSQTFGGSPPYLHWSQINLEAARIIFPAGLEHQAQQVASIIQKLSTLTLPTIGTRLHKIDIVFQNQTTISNGYVQLAPFRSEFQLTPLQNSFELGSLPWQKTLAIHEYRHVQQYNNYRVGLSKALYYLFGEGGQELGNSLSVPNWFWEGDAVYQETLVSRQGRGRLPFFLNGYKSLWAAEKNYSWMKLRNGSLRDYTPDHYPLGYMLVAYGRNKYGEEFWKNITRDAAAFQGVFYPLQKGIKKYSGLSFTEFRTQALDYFRQQQVEDRSAGSPAVFARSHPHFEADQEFPQFCTADSLVFMRSSYKRIPAFVWKNLQTGVEKRLKTRSVSLDNYFSYRNHQLVYSAYEPDIRWGWRDYSIIRLLDLKTGRERRLTSRTKLFSPDLSPDGLSVAAVQVNPDGGSQLQIISCETGKVEKSVPNPEGLFYTYPKFYGPSKLVSAVRNQSGEMALGLFDIADGSARWLTAFSMNVIGFPSVNQDTIYFSASHEREDRLYAWFPDQLNRVLLPYSNSSTGAYELQGFSGKYVWNSFTAVGYKMVLENAMVLESLDSSHWNQSPSLQGIHSLEKGMGDILNPTPIGHFPVGPYPYSGKLFNFHSWRPYINDPDYTFSLVSENVLSTLQSEIFVGYNRNEGYKQIGADATYSALFPWFDAGISYLLERNALYHNQKVFWNEMQAQGGLSIPLNLSRGRTFTNLRFGGDFLYNLRSYQGTYKDTFNTRSFTSSHLFLNFSHQTQQALQQIYPRFAQTLTIDDQGGVSIAGANQFLASGYFYFPGLWPVHSLVLGAAFQERDSLNKGGFSNSFPFSRGYSSENFYRMARFTANYHFPLIYPDAGLGNIVYFLRIRANLYYDYTRVMDPYDYAVFPEYRSFGTEIYFDTKWWNILAISFGIRYSRLLDPDYEGRGPNQWEFILPINLLSN
jgi:hypothetical protein